jgi:hypothetical protein
MLLPNALTMMRSWNGDRFKNRFYFVIYQPISERNPFRAESGRIESCFKLLKFYRKSKLRQTYFDTECMLHF